METVPHRDGQASPACRALAAFCACLLLISVVGCRTVRPADERIVFSSSATPSSADVRRFRSAGRNDEEVLAAYYERVLKECAPALSKFESLSVRRRSTAIWLTVSGLVAGTVAAPALVAAAAEANAAWTAGLAGWAGATTTIKDWLDSQGITSAEALRTREEIRSEFNEAIGSFLDPDASLDARIASLRKAHASCVHYAVTIPSVSVSTEPAPAADTGGNSSNPTPIDPAPEPEEGEPEEGGNGGAPDPVPELPDEPPGDAGPDEPDKVAAPSAASRTRTSNRGRASNGNAKSFEIPVDLPGPPERASGGLSAEERAFYERQAERSKIVGGREVPPGAYPWMVAIAAMSGPGQAIQYCGGSLVAPRWVLTAAHCEVEKGHVVILNRPNLKLRGGEVIKVADVLTAPFNAVTREFDAALLRLAHPSRQAPIRLIGAAEPDPQHGKRVRIAGWGSTEEGGAASRVLQHATVFVYDAPRCKRAYEPLDYFVGPGMMCTLAQGVDACQGDSGGPLMVVDPLRNDASIAAIVSWGEGCARPEYPGVYTRVGAVRDWIVQSIGNKP